MGRTRRIRQLSAVSLVACCGLLASCTPGLSSSSRYIASALTSGAAETVAFASVPDVVDGTATTLRMDIRQPVGDTATGRRLMLWIHGGSFTGGSRSLMGSFAADWTARGYVTASVDYRVDPTSRCRDIQDGVITDPAVLDAETTRCATIIGLARDDVLRAVAWLAARADQYRIDPSRIVLVGESAGAITALNVAQQRSASVVSVPSTVGFGAVLGLSGCQLQPDGSDLTSVPVSLAAGTDDRIVRFACVADTADRISAAGGSVQRVFFPAEGAHSILLYAKYRAKIDAEWTAFLFRHLGAS